MATTTTNDDRALGTAKGLGGVLDFAVRSHARAVFLLVVVALLAFVPGFFQMPPIDRDEARFAQATKQMVESGDYVDIRFQDEVRYKKPVGIYWMQAAVVEVSRKSSAWRNADDPPSGCTGCRLCSAPSVRCCSPIGRRWLSSPAAAAVLAGLIMCVLGACSMSKRRMAKTDAMLLLTVMIAVMGAMARVYLRELSERGEDNKQGGWLEPVDILDRAWPVSILVKGPLILMFVVLHGILVLGVMFDRSVALARLALKPLATAFPGSLLLVLPWFVAIYGQGRTAASSSDSLGGDMLSKLSRAGRNPMARLPAPISLLFWVTFWPGVALAAIAAPGVWAARREPGVRFLLAWLVPCWIVFEIVVTKLPHYVLPLYPAIAILIAGVIDTRLLARQPWLTRGAGWWFGFPLVAGIGAVVSLIVVARQLGLPAWPFLAGAGVFGFLAWWLYQIEGAERSLLRAVIASILLAIGIYAVILPALGVSPGVSIARVLRAADCPRPVAAAAGFHEPSLVFLVGTSTQLTDGAGAADFLRPGGCRFALVESRHERGFAQRAEALGLRYTPGPRVEGINLGSGRRVTIAVYRAEPTP